MAKSTVEIKINKTFWEGSSLPDDIKRNVTRVTAYKSRICKVHFAALGIFLMLKIINEKPKIKENSNKNNIFCNSKPANPATSRLLFSTVSGIKAM